MWFSVVPRMMPDLTPYLRYLDGVRRRAESGVAALPPERGRRLGRATRLSTHKRALEGEGGSPRLAWPKHPSGILAGPTR
jgi:hypothetical protein